MQLYQNEMGFHDAEGLKNTIHELLACMYHDIQNGSISYESVVSDFHKLKRDGKDEIKIEDIITLIQSSDDESKDVTTGFFIIGMCLSIIEIERLTKMES